MTMLTDPAMQRGTILVNSEQLQKLWGVLDERQKSMIGEMHLHYEAEFAKLMTRARPMDVAHAVHKGIDDAVTLTKRTKNGRKIVCKRGCAACCKVHVSITPSEAQLIVKWCEVNNVAIDVDKVRRQAMHGFATWGLQSPGERRCVFLTKDNSCSVYDVRPMACRKYFVASDPANCDSVKRPGAEVAVVATHEAEVMFSALFTVEPGATTMPKLLLKELDQ